MRPNFGERLRRGRFCFLPFEYNIGLKFWFQIFQVSNFMTVDRKLPRYCGLQKDLKMESDGAFFRVTFKSNDRFDGTGFHASYQFTPVADAVTITRRRSSSPDSSSPRES